jgi:hypothetical protein
VLRKEHGLRVFENRVLSRMCGPEREEMATGGRKLHAQELSANIRRTMKSMIMR